MKVNVVRIIISLYVSLVGILYVGSIILRELYELKFIREEF